MTLSILANIDVDDLNEAVDFYGRALQLRPGRRLGPNVVEMLGASCAIYLLEKPGGSATSPHSSQLRDYSRHWTPVHLDFVVPEIAEAVSRAQSAGARLEGEIRTLVWGSIAALADPFGNGFCLIEFAGRGYDEISDSGSSVAEEQA